MDPRLQDLKNYPRALQSYVLMLYELVYELRPEKMLEIGVQKGASTRTILLAMLDNKFGKLISIDRKRRGDFLGVEGDKYADLRPYWEFIQGDSTAPETIQAAKDKLDEDEQYGMLFIDGNHKMPIVQYDVDNYVPLVKPGGLVIMHDITNVNEEVSQAWAKIDYPNKFSLNWGRARNHVVPGLGIFQIPL